jgi:hypothetical protein
MDHVLTEQGLRLTYLRDPNVMNDLDQDRILEDLSDDTPDGDPLSVLTQYRLADYDHLVLVTDRSSGRYLAFLAANDRTTASEDFLLLESIFVATAARGQNLMRRMIALALLRIGGLGPVPSIIAACTRNPLCYRIIRDTAQRFRDAELYPDPESATINFHTATLAQRIARQISPNSQFHAATGRFRGVVGMPGLAYRRPMSNDTQIDNLLGSHMEQAERMLAVLDLRGKNEADILDTARRIYRLR